MKRNTIIYTICLLLYGALVVTLIIVNNTVFNNDYRLTTIITILIIMFIITWIFIIIYSKYQIKKDNEQFNDDFNKKLYKKMIDDQEAKLKKYFEYSMVMNTKFNLLIAYFYKGENEKAIEYLNKNRWHNFREDVIIFKGLAYLYNDDLDKALIELEKLKKAERKADYELLNSVCEAVKIKKKTSKVSKLSLPIIREIVKKL
ncbi:MAG: hypothetical protein K6E20_06330 [Acholeplasmatales bacterium]|nr:hypothetical protein [Acholeplasmatales bacterium]